MTDENGPEKLETPGMSEVSAKFVHEAAAPARNIQDMINAALGKIPPYSIDETNIAYIYRKLLAIRAGRPYGLSDDDMDAWVDEHDRIEAAINRQESRNTNDVDIKLAVLCDHLAACRTEAHCAARPVDMMEKPLRALPVSSRAQ